VFGEGLTIPPTGVLLHVGPHKTGTTAIQGALHQSRKAMKRHGVVYAGRERQHMMAALAVTGGKGLHGAPAAGEADWRRLVRQVERTTQKRVVVSSEFFDGADDATARQVVEQLGGDRVHVVITLRPLAKILPSAWQQYVRNRLRMSYLDWLDAMLNQPPYNKPTVTFWQRHHHDVQVERWVAAAGVDRVLVVVLDESDRLSLMRTFEQLLDLPDGFLKPETGWTNRSLTAAETELVRLLNGTFHDHEWPDEVYHNFVRRGAIRYAQRRAPAADEGGILTPKWALERVAEIGAAAATKIEGLGVRIVGDISTLGQLPSSGVLESAEPPEPVLPIAGVRDVVVGAIAASGALGPQPGIGPQLPPPGKRRKPAASDADQRPVDTVPTRELARILRQRVRARLRG
jgi:hypothetical protein